MGEIKSTLDIIMERTKGMTLTDEEKRDIQKREVEGRVQGLVQKLVDGLVDAAQVKKELAGFTEQKRAIADEVLRKEVISRIDPLSDNSDYLDVFREVLGLDPFPFSQALSDFGDTMASEASRRRSFLRAQFEKKGVSGEAVTPNLNADPVWNSYVKEKTRELRQKLSSA
jgi:ClpP class serine protease